MIKKINKYSDPVGEKMLRTKCIPVLSLTDDIKLLINDLAETCTSDPKCIGLTANQIWDDVIVPPPAVFVIRMADGVMPFINPELEKAFKKSEVKNEGCMSVTGKVLPIDRPKHIMVSFLDSEGNISKSNHLYYDLARVWLHEYDHIQGKLIIDYA